MRFRRVMNRARVCCALVGFAACGGVTDRSHREGDAGATSIGGTSAGRGGAGATAPGKTMPTPGGTLPAGGKVGGPVPVIGGMPSTGTAGEPPLPPGLSEEGRTISCDQRVCDSTSVGVGATKYYIDPCCTVSEACGSDTAFLAATGAMFADRCQARHQPGDLDATCPDSAPGFFPAGEAMAAVDAFRGCCRADGTCGVLVNQLTLGGGVLPLGDLELGCVEAAAFSPDDVQLPCGGGGAPSGAGGAE